MNEQCIIILHKQQRELLLASPKLFMVFLLVSRIEQWMSQAVVNPSV